VQNEKRQQKLARMPGNLARMPGNLARMPGNLARMPGRLARMPGNIETETPRDSACVDKIKSVAHV